MPNDAVDMMAKVDTQRNGIDIFESRLPAKALHEAIADAARHVGAVKVRMQLVQEQEISMQRQLSARTGRRSCPWQ